MENFVVLWYYFINMKYNVEKDSKKFYFWKQEDYSKYRPTYPTELFDFLSISEWSKITNVYKRSSEVMYKYNVSNHIEKVKNEVAKLLEGDNSWRENCIRCRYVWCIRSKDYL